VGPTRGVAAATVPTVRALRAGGTWGGWVTLPRRLGRVGGGAGRAGGLGWAARQPKKDRGGKPRLGHAREGGEGEEGKTVFSFS
jgi:hypothetical protein